jgi:hypothetical protein
VARGVRRRQLVGEPGAGEPEQESERRADRNRRHEQEERGDPHANVDGAAVPARAEGEQRADGDHRGGHTGADDDDAELRLSGCADRRSLR